MWCLAHRGGKLFTSFKGRSRIENGFTLMQRIGLEPFGVISAKERTALRGAAGSCLGTWAQLFNSWWWWLWRPPAMR
jgi:hypothetical protein